jgi:two-component system alkaline phosphatase synthesis response regulator PhoP
MNDSILREYKILLVDDEEDILDMLAYNLKNEGYKVKSFTDPDKALSFSAKWSPQLIMLDIMMPGTDGIALCKKMREIPELDETVIIFLTARTEEYTQIAAFESGADAFITKPIRPRALISRINAIYQRKKQSYQSKSLLKVYGLTLDRANYQVITDKKKFNLAKKEFDLLNYLMKNNDRVLSREEILANVWGSNVLVSPRTVDVHIRKIREKIGDSYIQTVKSVGYKFTTPS